MSVSYSKLQKLAPSTLILLNSYLNLATMIKRFTSSKGVKVDLSYTASWYMLLHTLGVVMDL